MGGGSVWEECLTLLPRLEFSGMITVPGSLNLLGSSNPPTSASQAAGTTGVHHCTWVTFCRDGVLPYGVGWSQSSGFKPSSCLHLAEITGLSHCVPPQFTFYLSPYVLFFPHFPSFFPLSKNFWVFHFISATVFWLNSLILLFY